MRNEYEIRGDTAVIFIRRKDGSTVKTIVSKEDLPRLLSFDVTWCVTRKHTGRLHVCANVTKNGKKTTIPLHRFLVDCPKGKVVDHINGDTLDNRRQNLRVVSNAENLQNRQGLNANNSSGVRGVSWDKARGKWQAKIKVNYKTIHLGRFDDIEEARKAVEEAICKYMPFAISSQ